MRLTDVIIFVSGVGVGAAGMYFGLNKVLKDKYVEELANTREELKAIYAPKKEEKKEEEPKHIGEFTTEKPSLVEYNKISSKYSDEEKEKMKKDYDGPMLIRYEDINDDYKELVYYSDGFLIDENDCEIDIDNIGGEEMFENFGTGEDPDIIYVRNDILGVDYEIVRDDRTYAEVSGKDPDDLYSDYEDDDY